MSNDLTLARVLRETTLALRHAGVESAELTARYLVMQAFDMSREDLILKSDDKPSLADYDALKPLIARHIDGEPLDSILGYSEFYGRKFKISTEVLSPRPETEELVAAALELLKDVSEPNILDLGTGSGAILISLLCERTDARGLGIDISRPALTIAKDNATIHGVETRLDLRHGSWLSPVRETFNVIISNPPYIDDVHMAELDISVSNFDPHIALRGGPDGLDAYREIIGGLSQHLKPQGHVIFEIGYDQGETVPELLQQAGYSHIDVLKDVYGQNRIVRARN